MEMVYTSYSICSLFLQR